MAELSTEPAHSPTSAAEAGRPLLIAVPLYKAPELVPTLFAALIAMADEIAALRGTVLLINDSPDDAPLRAMLDAELPALRGALAVELRENERNLGFVQSANRALNHALTLGADVILLNSDTVPTPGAFREMAAVAALDPMTSVVSPRSDNATICNSPYVDAYRTGSLDERLRNHEAIARYLPRITYVPTAVGFCLYIRNLMLREFGVFDEIYGGGYNEENDFIRRCNQCGYRAVMANRAYVHHTGSVSFAMSSMARQEREDVNHAILVGRYPEYDRIVRRYFESADYYAQRVTSGLIPDAAGRLRILFDCRLLRTYHNGTSENAVRLLRAFATRHCDRFVVAVTCGADAFAFHRLDEIDGIAWCDEAQVDERPFAICLRLGQPFEAEAMMLAARSAAITGFYMLDTIALDCQQVDINDLDTVWQQMFDLTDIVAFNSDFTREQFERRFDIPVRAVAFVGRCSTDIADYAAGPDDARGEADGGVLLIGNHYPHKHVRATLAAYREHSDGRVVVLGMPLETDGDTIVHTAGDLPQSMVDGLYDDAELLLFPSHYEGFGLPILHALARGKPVVGRDLPVSREIKARTPVGANLHLRETTAEIVELAAARPRWQDGVATGGLGSESWGDTADAFAAAFEKALRHFDFAACKRRQLHLGRIRKTFDAEALQAATRRRADDFERLASENHQRADAERSRGDVVATRLGEQLGQVASDLQELRERQRLMHSDRGPPILGWLASLPWMRRGDAPAKGAGTGLDEVAIDATGLDLRDRDFTEQLLDSARTLRLGGRLTLELPRGAGADVAAIVANAGFGVDPAAGDSSGSRVRAIKYVDWAAALPGPQDDELFVQMIHRRTLGRAPSHDEIAHGRHRLHEGGSRESLLRGILAGNERHDFVRKQIHGR